MRERLRCAGFIVFSLLTLPTFTHAAEVHWANPAGGAFDSAGNWDPMLVPGADDLAVFDLPGSVMIDFPTLPPGSAISTAGLEVRNSDVTFDATNYRVGASGLRVAGSGDHLTRLRLNGGGINTPWATISGPAQESAALETTLQLWDEASLYSTGPVIIGAEQGEAGHVQGYGTSDQLYVGYAGKGTLHFGANLNDVGGWSTRELEIGSLAGSDGLAELSGGEMFVGANVVIGREAGAVGHLNLIGAGLRDSSPEGFETLVVGKAGKGTLVVSRKGFVLGQDVTLAGVEPGGEGHITVTGSPDDMGTTSFDAGPLLLGGRGSAYLRVEGASVSSGVTFMGTGEGGYGEATITNKESIWFADQLQIGHGKVEILDGGRLVTGSTFIGGSSGSGSVRLAGEDSSWSSSSISIGGLFGEAPTPSELRVETGTTLTLSSRPYETSITVWEQGVLTIDGGTVRTERIINRGGALNFHSGLLEITRDSAIFGNANSLGNEVTLQDGFHLKSPLVWINPGAEVTLVGARMEASDFFVGNDGLLRGDGRITGGFVNLFGGQLFIGDDESLRIDDSEYDSGNHGQLELAGGAIEVDDDFENSGLFTGHGRLHVGGPANNRTLAIRQTGRMELSEGDFEVVASEFLNQGLVALAPTTTLSLVGDLLLDDTSRLTMRLSASDQSLWSIEGAASLDGVIALNFANFAPQAGQYFELLTATEGITGGFEELHWQGLSGPVTVALEYTHNSVFVNIISLLLPGDFNLDGTVDARDYTVWRNTLGDMGADLAADANDDGVVNQLDYVVWKDNFGLNGSSGDTLAQRGAPVPEPATLAVLALAIALAFGRIHPEKAASAI